MTESPRIRLKLASIPIRDRYEIGPRTANFILHYRVWIYKNINGDEVDPDPVTVELSEFVEEFYDNLKWVQEPSDPIPSNRGNLHPMEQCLYALRDWYKQFVSIEIGFLDIIRHRTGFVIPLTFGVHLTKHINHISELRLNIKYMKTIIAQYVDITNDGGFIQSPSWTICLQPLN